MPWEIQQPPKDEHAIIKVSLILCLSDRREIIELGKMVGICVWFESVWVTVCCKRKC